MSRKLVASIVTELLKYKNEQHIPEQTYRKDQFEKEYVARFLSLYQSTKTLRYVIAIQETPYSG